MRIEAIFTRLDDPPFDALHRVAIGWFAYAILWRVCGADAPVIAWLLAFTGILLALRVIPALLRKALRFSDAAQEIWFARRQIAKRYDSYQWQKLLWIGIGLAFRGARTGTFRTAPVVLTMTCVIAGTLGTVVWHVRKKQERPHHAAAVSRPRALAG